MMSSASFAGRFIAGRPRARRRPARGYFTSLRQRADTTRLSVGDAFFIYHICDGALDVIAAELIIFPRGVDNTIAVAYACFRRLPRQADVIYDGRGKDDDFRGDIYATKEMPINVEAMRRVKNY